MAVDYENYFQLQYNVILTDFWNKVGFEKMLGEHSLKDIDNIHGYHELLGKK